MGKESTIEWTNDTWNPWQGCQKVSQGCKNCYMFREKKRYGQFPGIVVRSSDATFNAPLKLKGPFVFTCSWSDFFIPAADKWRAEAWDIIRATPHLTYQILTKRPENIWGRLPKDWGDGYPNVWLGVSVEDQETANERISVLMNIPGQIRFVSAEPLLSPIDFTKILFGKTWESGVPKDFYANAFKRVISFFPGRWDETFGIQWVITGGESGPDARPAAAEWFESIKDQCACANVPYFHKQNGGTRKIDGVSGGRELHGVVYHQFPSG